MRLLALFLIAAAVLLLGVAACEADPAPEMIPDSTVADTVSTAAPVLEPMTWSGIKAAPMQAEVEE